MFRFLDREMVVEVGSNGPPFSIHNAQTPHKGTQNKEKKVG